MFKHIHIWRCTNSNTSKHPIFRSTHQWCTASISINLKAIEEAPKSPCRAFSGTQISIPRRLWMSLLVPFRSTHDCKIKYLWSLFHWGWLPGSSSMVAQNVYTSASVFILCKWPGVSLKCSMCELCRHNTLQIKKQMGPLDCHQELVLPMKYCASASHITIN